MVVGLEAGGIPKSLILASRPEFWGFGLLGIASVSLNTWVESFNAALSMFLADTVCDGFTTPSSLTVTTFFSESSSLGDVDLSPRPALPGLSIGC